VNIESLIQKSCNHFDGSAGTRDRRNARDIALEGRLTDQGVVFM
jgi:hypothetical protein